MGGEEDRGEGRRPGPADAVGQAAGPGRWERGAAGPGRWERGAAGPGRSGRMSALRPNVTSDLVATVRHPTLQRQPCHGSRPYAPATGIRPDSCPEAPTSALLDPARAVDRPSQSVLARPPHGPRVRSASLRALPASDQRQPVRLPDAADRPARPDALSSTAAGGPVRHFAVPRCHPWLWMPRRSPPSRVPGSR